MIFAYTSIRCNWLECRSRKGCGTGYKSDTRKSMIANIFILLTCLLHGYFCVLEMFLWTTPFGLKTFKMSQEKADSSKVLAANQGLYNGMLALGLLLSFLISNPISALSIQAYILAYIVIVGTYGAYSLKSQKVFLIQALPALLGLIALLLGI